MNKIKPLKEKYESEEQLENEFCEDNTCSNCFPCHIEKEGDGENFGCDELEKFIDENSHLIERT